MEKKETYHILEDEKTTVLTKKQFNQELDKAREEGRRESKREYIQALAIGEEIELTDELVDKIWSANLGEMYKMGLTKLLKTKEDEK